MHYNALLEKIFSAFPMYHRVGSSAYKEGLENIESLAVMAGHPEKSFDSVHIAGTNGKGSVASLFSSFFQELGMKTGLYTSPHLVHFNERIKINGNPMPEEEIISFFEHYEKELAEIEPSFFEMTTMLAFDYFAREEVDIAIIETGLGGRLDATNIISPKLSVITNISADHTQFLGTTLPEIAKEKGGIIKKNIPVVIGEYHPETFPVFKVIAAKNNAPLYLAEENFTVVRHDTDSVLPAPVTVYRHQNAFLDSISFPLNGDYQLKNLSTFLQGTEILRDYFPFDLRTLKDSIEHVVVNTRLEGRWQEWGQTPRIICDAGHNPGALALTMQQLRHAQVEHLHFVFGMVNDKDIESVFPLLPKERTTYYVCRADIERALDPQTLNGIMEKHGFHTEIYPNVKDAFKAARKNARPEDIIFIGGSCFVIGDFLKIAGRHPDE